MSPATRSAFISAQPSPMASTTPTTVPSMAMITASQRIDRLSWVRSMPTARSRPSSRTRSLIDSDSVLATPIRAMMIESSSRIVMKLTKKVTWSAMEPMKPSWSSTCRPGVSSMDVVDPRDHLVDVGALVDGAEEEGVERRLGVGQ